MRIRECRDLLHTQLSGMQRASNEKTALGNAAVTVLEMADSYKSDGDMFYSAGDPVNALASYWYGLGWLHFGCTYGLLRSSLSLRSNCPFQGPTEILPERFGGKLKEKTSRYGHLIDTARFSVEPAPDTGTEIFGFADRVLCITAIYSVYGHRFMDDGSPEAALACFSYGHGWLDAAVRSGLIRIRENRELFTV